MSKREMVNKRVAKFNFSKKKTIFHYLELTSPMHKLTNKKVKLLTEIIYMYIVEKPNFKREVDLWRYIFNKDNRELLRDKLDMNKQVFHNYLTDFRKRGIIQNNQVTPVYNPFTNPKCKKYELVFEFTVDE